MPDLPSTSGRPARHSLSWLLTLLLVGVTYLLYSRMSEHEFINFDDPIYITENSAVQAGLTWESLSWALSSQHASNWHPLTWISHMLDVSLFGVEGQAAAAAHHRTNAMLHALNAALCFLMLAGLLRAAQPQQPLDARRLLWIAFFGAAGFAWHPLRVESVAWVSERKDLLAACFWFLAVLAYLRYVRSRSVWRYLLVVLALALSLLSKPMAVTLPCLLLVFDCWPLRRGLGPKLWLEKFPMLLLVLASCLITMRVQRAGGAFDELDALGVSERIAGAFSAQATYLRQMFWPGELGFFYPHRGVLHPEGYQAWDASTLRALAVFVVLSSAAFALRRRLPWLAVGWLWFLGMLVPVSGLLQVGGQAHADRYTYLPSIGIALALSASLGWNFRFAPLCSRICAGLGLLFLAWLMPQTMRQVETWKSSHSACLQSLAAAEQNWVAHNNMGRALESMGDMQGAYAEYVKVLKLRPEHVLVQYNLAHTLLAMQRWKPAERGLRKILSVEPGFHSAHSDLGVLLAKQGRGAEAIAHLEFAWGHPEEPLKKRAEAGKALAWVLSTIEPKSLRDGQRAIEIIQSCMTLGADWNQWNTLAAAQAQAGGFAEAAEAQRRSLDSAPLHLHEDLQRRLQSYLQGRQVE